MEMGLIERQMLRADLRTALSNDEFELKFQPLMDLRTEQICSFETLIRWNHPTRGVITPDIFIPIAEESGLIVSIGEWVLKEACLEAAKWPSQIAVAVNLSTREFASGELTANVRKALKNSGLDAERLELEITETVLFRNSRANLAQLHRLREMGVHIALDDFGTGYSSLAYLQQFPFSKIKIDRSFVSGLPQSASSQAIVRSVIGLGIALGMRVTAEGVETQAQFEWVKLGCNEAQGYFISRPVSGADVAGLIETVGSRPRTIRHTETRMVG
jgi:EAL domain-containing protein (putative c-di-GMP-specific phosphodiesterase class I)